MRTLIIIQLIFLTGCAHLDKTDRAMLLGYGALCVADYYQTVDGLRDSEMVELNPFIESEEDAVVFTLGLPVVIGGFSLLLDERRRKMLLSFLIGGKYITVVGNYQEMNNGR